MGGAVSTGKNNSQLIDNLVDYDYIHTVRVERVFRAVDRGEYIQQEYRLDAYKDQAWRHLNYHLSAPCIYTEALEGLKLRPGLSFLNLGSGTGYLSTMAGLILGSNGVNHGVEFYDDVVQYANLKLDEFKKFSGAIDEFDFCDPLFIQGNCLELGVTYRYDRIYVGASCPEKYDNVLKAFLKIGGIMVMPFRDTLIQITRVSETSYNVFPLISVTYATLIAPKSLLSETRELPNLQPKSLIQMCRNKIRNTVREKINKDLPELKFHSSRMFKHLKRYHKIEQNDDFEYTSLVNRHSCDEEEAMPEVKRKKLCDELLSTRRLQLDNTDSNDSDDSSSFSDMEMPENTPDARSEALEYFTSPSFAFDWNINLNEESEDEDTDESPFNGHRDRSLGRSEDELDLSNSELTDSDMEPSDRRVVKSPYSPLMLESINKLPLPEMLKNYLNYHRI